MTARCEAIAGYPVSTEVLAECIAKIQDWICSGSQVRYFVCANPHSIEMARRDALYDRALKATDLLVPDGAGMVLASRIMGGRIRQRITGSDIFRELSKVLNEHEQCRYFFLGSTESVLQAIKERMKRDFPGISVVGAYSPPFAREFTSKENRLMIEAINRTQPDVLWVGMTAPKQEKWIYQYKDRLNVKFIGAIGAVFDFYAGTVKRPHPWFLNHGLEWLSRLVRDPRRLWKRTFVSAPMFLYHVLTEKVRGRVTGM